MTNEAALRSFGQVIGRLTAGDPLSRQETKEAFRQVITDEQPDLQQGAFLAALTAKGETPDEIAGAWEAIYELDTVRARPQTDGPLVENSGTGMDALKTFNISTAASVVAAAGGICMARHGARAITSACGAVDMAEALGVDVECDVSLVSRSIERAGIGLFNGMSAAVHPRALHRILSQIRFGSTLNIAASLANPAAPTHALRGVYAADLVQTTAEVMAEIGYRRALVVHGRSAASAGGMDEWSVLGETDVAELRDDGRIVRYVVAPEDLGVGRAAYAAIRPLDGTEAEAVRMVRLMAGHDDTARSDAVCLNAGPIFWLMGKADDLRSGVELARRTLASGQALAKLREWVTTQTRDSHRSQERLDVLERAAQR